MKSAEARDTMVARVQATFKKFPKFEALPETAGGDLQTIVNASDAGGYVSALYSICAEGEVVGRNGNRVIGKRA